jgi:hypothetical protein
MAYWWKLQNFDEDEEGDEDEGDWWDEEESDEDEGETYEDEW